MQATICTRCKKHVAVIFITKMENGKTENEGICLKCARELNLKPVDDIMKKMGISEEDLDGLSNEMIEAFGGVENLGGVENGEGDEEPGNMATFPFLNKLFGGLPGGERPGAPGLPNNPLGGGKEPGKEKNGGSKKRRFLESYCISLSQKAREFRLDRIVGREKELERVIQILNRRQKNNPCLIGEPGVGKTAIAEGLAMRIFTGDVPYKLQDKEVYLLDLTALVAGTQFRGQFESRMKGLIEEIKQQGNIILVIDEVHTIVGAGDAEGSMNAANILKPALSRGEIQVIGATTFTEYRKHIEKDSALERRFQPVTVAEPSITDAIEIISGIAHYYEKFHHVTIPAEVARQAVLMSERYITDRFLPDKAIDLIDEACSDVNLKSVMLARVEAIRKEQADLGKERDMLLADPTTEEENYARLAVIRSREMQLGDELIDLQKEGPPELKVEHLAHVVELWTKIPASSIREDEYKRLAQLESRLKAHVIGQDEAVKTVCRAIKRSRVGIQAKRKPASFIFVGSTGVGKTELVKRLAQDLFDATESLIRLDMSEFMEKHAVSRIIGSPPGYVGYDEAGQLTEKVRRKPYSVVLFDEIEKAHADVLNVLLQILDDGHITYAQGRRVNFENTVVIMTTNAGSDKKDGAVGFNRSVNEQGKEKAVKALKDFLRPEFINRVDEIVYFNQLTQSNFEDIAKLMMEELRQVMEEKGYTLSYDDTVLGFLAKKSFSMTYGARNLRRLVQTEIEDKIAEELVDNYDRGIKKIGLTVKKEEIVILAV